MTALKLGAAALSQSVGVLSEGIHSFLDLVSAAISFFTVREAGKPADEDHPFGHGKIETLSSLFESLLLVVAAGLIVYEGIEHIQHPHPIQHGGIAIGVMIISLIVSYVIYRHNASAASETESSALHVNALHFLSDVLASIGVLVGLIVLQFTGWLWVDPIIGFVVASYILLISMKQVKGALVELADTQLPAEEIQSLKAILQQQAGGSWIEIRHLRTRKSGSTRHIDFHLVVCGYLTVQASHEVCDQLEMNILEIFPRASVNIHVEPCEKYQAGCREDCPIAESTTT